MRPLRPYGNLRKCVENHVLKTITDHYNGETIYARVYVLRYEQ